jgi:SulP family sulfate permease
MSAIADRDRMNAGRASFAEMFTPKLVTVWREGYSLANLRSDVMAGLTVAIVALPLSMAIAIGCGARPETGLYTSVVGGFVISALGGSRFQIGGPAGAFIVLVATTIARYGYDGFLLATIMAGLLLLLIGYLRLGTYIKYIPHPVTVGFTSGIAVIIFAGEIRDLLGLRIEHEPGPLIAKIPALVQAFPTFNAAAVGMSVLCIGLILGVRAWKPKFPGLLLVVALGAFLTWAFDLPIETVGSRFGEVPRTLPFPALPPISLARIIDLVPAAIAIALLGGIESLLSAVVADGMTGRRHRSNCELVAQGYANIVSALFGGLCATGTIARTATNIRAHAHGPIAGILHSLFLLTFMLVAAPLASHIPLAALASVLAIVAWNMAEKAQFAAILKHDRGEAAVLLATFLLTVFRDLTEGIAVGVTLGSILFMHRMANIVQVRTHSPLIEEDRPDSAPHRAAFDSMNNGDVQIYRIAGPFFFGAASAVAKVLDEIGGTPKVFIFDLSAVPLADATAAQTLKSFVDKAARKGTKVILAGAEREVMRTLWQNGLTRQNVTYVSSLEEGRKRALR